MRTALYLFVFAAVLSTAACTSKPDSAEATEGTPVIREDTAVDRTHVEAPVAPVNDTPASPDTTVGP